MKLEVGSLPPEDQRIRELEAQLVDREAALKGAEKLFDSHCRGAGHSEKQMCPVCVDYKMALNRASYTASLKRIGA